MFKRLFFGIIQRVICAYYRLHKNDTYVFMFHEINASGNLSITESNFKAFIDGITDKKIPFLSAYDVFNDGPKAVITFDDVYESAVLYALPYLNEHKIPYTLFISPSLVGREGYITSAQIRELKKNDLCTIAFHSVSHKLMRNLGKNESALEVLAEDFDQEYGIISKLFAYPYGSVYACSKENITMVKDLGYKAGFGTVNSATNAELSRKNPYYIPRINVSDATYKKILDGIK